jgi:hypothetical protein
VSQFRLSMSGAARRGGGLDARGGGASPCLSRRATNRGAGCRVGVARDGSFQSGAGGYQAQAEDVSASRPTLWLSLWRARARAGLGRPACRSCGPCVWSRRAQPSEVFGVPRHQFFSCSDHGSDPLPSPSLVLVTSGQSRSNPALSIPRSGAARGRRCARRSRTSSRRRSGRRPRAPRSECSRGRSRDRVCRS